MAGFQETVNACQAFASALFDLSEDGHFSGDERETFGRLFTMYKGALEGFVVAPAYGSDSANYDRPKRDGERGSAACPAARPSDPSSQQPVFDAAHFGSASLKAVTKAVPRFAS